MGLFSRKTIITASSQHISLLDEADNLDKKAVLAAVLSRTPIAEGIIKAKMYGMYSMAERYYNYGKNQYTNGLPEGTGNHSIVTNTRILPVLVSVFPEYTGINIIQAVQDIADPALIVRDILIAKYRYNFTTDIASNPPAGMTSPVLVVGTSFAEGDNINITFLGQNSQETVTVTEPVPNYDSVKSYLYVTFTHSGDSEGITWTYELGTGVHPTLELNSPIDMNSAYYPIVPIRDDNVDMTHESLKSTDLYKTSKFILSKLNMDMLDLGNTINSNENVDNIDFVTFGVKVDIRDDAPVVTEYLSRYFYSLYQANIHTKEAFNAWLVEPTGLSPPHTTIVIQDGSSRTSLNFNYIDSVDTIGDLEAPTVVFNILPREVLIQKVGLSLREYELSTVTYTYQPSPNVIRTVVVHGLMTVDYVYNDATIDINLADSAEETSKLMIPIHRDTVRTMNLGERNKLFHSAMYLTIITYDKRKEKWYETSVFRFVITIIGIILIIVSYGAVTPYVAAALGVSYAVAVLIVFALQMLIAAAIKYAVAAIIEIFGLESAGWILAVLVIVYIYVTEDFKGGMEIFSGLTNGYVEVVDDIMEDIAKEVEILREEAAELSNTLDAIMEKLLGDRPILDAAVILTESRRVEPIYLASESAKQYYDRIFSGGNIPTILLSGPSMYHEISLSQQTLDELLHTFKRG